MKTPLFAALLTLTPIFGAEVLKTTETDSAITITHGENTVLVYHKAELTPPEGVKPIYKRSG
ncbi:MAG: hypothetical protein ACK57I_11675, partial [Akkermansiaceae bacterium]